MINVLVNGSKGKMGSEVVKAVLNDNGLQLVAKTNSGDDLQKETANSKAQVVVDFTHPSGVYDNIIKVLSSGAFAVVGTTGLTLDQRKQIDTIARKSNLAVLIAPNFCIGALLMKKYSAEVAKYMPDVEIIEYHHDNKADAPSGTAIDTAEYINSETNGTNPPAKESSELLDLRTQGGKIGNIRIHAVRLPGFIASQEVLFGAPGHTLKIRHDTISREAFMPGVIVGIKKIINKTGLVYGLENLLFE